MSYGKDFYPRALRILTGTDAEPEPSVVDDQPTAGQEPAESNE